MKKVINGKSYNTEYDSRLVAVYTNVIDSWCRTKHYFYQKKSTGEYFEFSGEDSWHSGDITLVSEDMVKNVISHVKKGEKYRYTALMESAKTLKRGYSMWGTEKDDPWDEDMAKMRAEDRKRMKEEAKKKEAEVKEGMKEDKLWGVSHWGVLEVTGCSDGFKFEKCGGKEIPSEKVGKVVGHKVNLRIVNNDFRENKGSRGWYKYHYYIVMPAGSSKGDVKKTIFDMMAEVEKEYGYLDPVMKDGVFLAPAKNSQMMRELHKKIDTRNGEMSF